MTYENENKNTEEETAPEESDVDAVGSVEQETPKKGITHHMISWAVFILLGSAMAYLRYGGKTSEATLEQIKTFAPFVVLLIYVIIVLQAFKDAVSQGIITFLLPPYAFYYLFLVSDNFYMRAVVGAILIAMGEDAVMTYKDVAIDVFGHVNHWLRTIGYGD